MCFIKIFIKFMVLRECGKRYNWWGGGVLINSYFCDLGCFYKDLESSDSRNIGGALLWMAVTAHVGFFVCTAVEWWWRPHCGWVLRGEGLVDCIKSREVALEMYSGSVSNFLRNGFCRNFKYVWSSYWCALLSLNFEGRVGAIHEIRRRYV